MDPYIIPRSNFSQLSLSLSFSLPRFSCVTLSGASSHFALVASHSVSLPNIVGVVFCTRIRIRSTMKLTKGLYTRRKEGRKKKEKKVESPPPPSLLVCALFLCLFGGRKAGVDGEDKKKERKKRGERNLFILRTSDDDFCAFSPDLLFLERERERESAGSKSK